MSNIEQVFVIKAKLAGNILDTSQPIATVFNVPVASLDHWINSGWLVCNGDEYPINEYPDLYDCIGNAYSKDTVELERSWWMKLFFISPITIKVKNCKPDCFRVPNHGKFTVITDQFKEEWK